MKRGLLLGVAALLCVTALLAIGILVVGRFGDTQGRVLGSTLLVAGYGVVGVPGAILLDRGRFRLLASACLLLAGLAAVLALVSIWAASDVDIVGRSVGTATIFALAAAQAAALAVRHRRTDPHTVRSLFVLSNATAAIAAAFATTLLWAEPGPVVYLRLLGALVVLDLLLAALQPLLARAARGGGRPTRAAARSSPVGRSPSRPAS